MGVRYVSEGSGMRRIVTVQKPASTFVESQDPNKPALIGHIKKDGAPDQDVFFAEWTGAKRPHGWFSQAWFQDICGL